MLQGRLGITRELLAFTSAQCKFNLGSENGGVKFIKVNFRFCSVCGYSVHFLGFNMNLSLWFYLPMLVF